MKRPSFQFYPADWRKDAALQSCSLQAQGLWINIMCIAHECDPYGYLVVNCKPMNPAQIGRLVGVSQKEAMALLAELEDAGVLSVDDNGAIFSRRMVRDEEIRNARAAGGKDGAEHGKKGAEHGKKGGRPKKQTGDKNPPSYDEETGDKKPPLEPPPSSSSSSSTSVNPTVVERVGNSTSVARAQISPGEISPSAQVCLGLKSMGYSDTNPHDFELSALLQEGMTPDEILAVGSEFKGQGKRFRYLLKTAAGRRRDAANIQPLPSARHNAGKPITTGDERAYASAVLTGKVPATTTIEEFIDRRRSPDMGTSILIEGESKHVA
jgi:hypothetical protein